MKNWKNRITINPNISHGRPCIKGTRVWVSLIVDNFAAGSSEDEILKAYPSLTRRISMLHWLSLPKCRENVMWMYPRNRKRGR